MRDTRLASGTIMTDFKDKLLAALLVFASATLLALGIWLGRLTNRPTTPVEPQVDTLYLHDTIKVTKPVYLTRRVIDTMEVYIPVHDTVVLVQLPREQIEWRDSLATVWASGYQPQVDSIEHYSTTKIITKEMTVPVKVQPRWAVGISAGYGAGKDGLTPWLGVGVTYVIKSW